MEREKEGRRKERDEEAKRWQNGRRLAAAGLVPEAYTVGKASALVSMGNSAGLSRQPQVSRLFLFGTSPLLLM